MISDQGSNWNRYKFISLEYQTRETGIIFISLEYLTRGATGRDIILIRLVYLTR
jgi:hypothetical protein